MHSNILCFATDQKDGYKFLDADIDIDDVVKCHSTADYVGSPLPASQMEDFKKWWTSNDHKDFFPPFIKIEGDKLVVAPDSNKQYIAWFKQHVERINQYHDKWINTYAEKSPSMMLYMLGKLDVWTESEDVNIYEDICTLFIVYDCDSHPYMTPDGYNSFIERLSLKFAGKTLYLCNAIDYHY